MAVDLYVPKIHCFQLKTLFLKVLEPVSEIFYKLLFSWYWVEIECSSFLWSSHLKYGVTQWVFTVKSVELPLPLNPLLGY